MNDIRITAHRARSIQAAPERRTGWTKARRKRFLDVLAATCNVRMAAAAVGVQAGSAYYLRKRDAAFAELWREALATGYDTLEAALLEQALTGVNAIEIEPAADVASPSRGDPGGHAMVPAEPASLTRLQFGLALLNRHRAEVTGQGRGIKARRMPTEEETNVVLRQKLDRIARRIAARKA